MACALIEDYGKTKKAPSGLRAGENRASILTREFAPIHHAPPRQINEKTSSILLRIVRSKHHSGNEQQGKKCGDKQADERRDTPAFGTLGNRKEGDQKQHQAQGAGASK